MMAQELEVVSHGESRGPLTVLGLVCLAVGAYFLLNPEAPRGDMGLLGDALDALPPIANLQLLVIGQTLTLMGALFLGFAWRPIRAVQPVPEGGTGEAVASKPAGEALPDGSCVKCGGSLSAQTGHLIEGRRYCGDCYARTLL